jgi:hypothetical protein
VLRRAHDTVGPSAADIGRSLREAKKEALKNTGED